MSKTGILTRIRFSAEYAFRGKQGRLRLLENPRVPPKTLLKVARHVEVGSNNYTLLLRRLSEQMDQAEAVQAIFRERIKKIGGFTIEEIDQELLFIAAHQHAPPDVLEKLASDSFVYKLSRETFTALRIAIGGNPNAPPQVLESLAVCVSRGGITRSFMGDTSYGWGSDKRIAAAIANNSNASEALVRRIYPNKIKRPRSDAPVRQPREVIIPVEDGEPRSTAPAVFAQIFQQVRQLIYLSNPSEVAEALSEMAQSWDLENLAKKSKDVADAEKVDSDRASLLEIEIISEIANKIKTSLPSYGVEGTSLIDVLKMRRANCAGYAQLFYIFASVLGLEAAPFEADTSLPESQGFFRTSQIFIGAGHAACLVTLRNKNRLIVELTPDRIFISQTFDLKENFKEDGYFLKYIGNPENPISVYRAIRIFGIRGLVAFIYSNLGAEKLEAGGAPREALECFEAAIKSDPNYAGVYVNQARAYEMERKYGHAIVAYARAERLNPKDEALYINRGALKDKIGKPGEAEGNFRFALKINPKSALAFYNLGNLYLAQGRIEDAIRFFSRAIELNPKFAQAYKNRGVAERMRGQTQEATRDFAKAVELDPSLAQHIINPMSGEEKLLMVARMNAEFKRKLSSPSGRKEFVEAIKKEGNPQKLLLLIAPLYTVHDAWSKEVVAVLRERASDESLPEEARGGITRLLRFFGHK